MFLRIEKGSSVPVSRQLADQIAAHCASGTLPVGTRVPSVRELARELAVNQNTVLRVYDRLCAEGILEARHGQGTFVAARATKRQLASQRARLVDEMRQWVRQAIGLGLTPDQLHELLDEAMAGSVPSSVTSSRQGK